MKPRRLFTILLVVAAAGPLGRAGAAERAITLTVDAREAPRHILHAHMSIPAKPGRLTLLYPKWIPGEHGPTGPITDLAGIQMSAGGRPVAWRRDPVNMYALHLEVPPSASAIDVSLDYLVPPARQGFSSGASTSAKLMVLEWNLVLLYPAGFNARELTYAAKLVLPSGWRFGSALELARQSEGELEFRPVTLEMLIDSPVIAGAFFQSLPLAEEVKPSHFLDLAADSATALAIKPEAARGYAQLVREAGALFGARHYQRYHFLLALSDQVAHFGLEHHQSSDNRVRERALIDESLFKLSSGLLPHEFVHSWNGKYRRPAGLATGDYEHPMQGELLWVYEGLTSYLGTVLNQRSGLVKQGWTLDDLALMAATLDHRPGRNWRPLEDTAVAAQVLYGSPVGWDAWRRSVDFYPEGVMLWLDADVIIRRQSKGARSLDDFCRRFYDGQSGPPLVKAYTYKDVVRTLGEVLPYDWAGFFRSRVEATAAHPPLGGIEGGGFRLVYTDKPNERLKAEEAGDPGQGQQPAGPISVAFSLGMVLRSDGTVADVIPGTPAAQAGLGPGMRMVAVNGRRFTKSGLIDALKAHKTVKDPIELIMVNGDYFATFKVDYHGGERYPHLERDAARPDILSEILKPRAKKAGEAE